MTTIVRLALLPALPLALAAAAVSLQDQEGAPADDPVVVGEGAHAYRWVPDWLQLPDGMSLGNTHGCVCVDSDGRVLFNTDAEHAIVVTEPDGTFVEALGKEWAGGLHGMTIAREGEGEEARDVLYVSHTGRHEFAKLTRDGDVLWRRGYPRESGVYEEAGQFRPTAIVVAPNGDVYVADGYGRSYVHRFSADGTWLATFGGPGTEDGRMRTPHGLLLDERDGEHVLVVCDRENHRLQVFGLDGEHRATHAPGLRRPCNVARRGDLYVVADLVGRITLLDADFAVVAHLGDNPDPAKRAKNGVPLEAWADGAFLSPHGVAFGPDGSIYVMDWNRHGRMTKLAPTG